MKTTAQLHAARRKAALDCAKKLEAATTALNKFTRSCNDCNDESASITRQGKGIDGRETLASQMSEYSVYLAGRYERETE
jgi:hypothetical protein